MGELFSKALLVAKTYARAHAAIKRQYDAAEIQAVQNKKIRKLMDYAYHHIQYYHELFDKAGITPTDIRTRQDIAKIPMLTKNELRSRLWEFWPKDLPVCRLNLTSGSTGEPVCILSDRNSRSHNSAMVIRCRKANGVGIMGNKILTPLRLLKEPWKTDPRWVYLQGVHKTYYVNPHIDTAESREFAANVLKKMNGAALIGFCTAVRKLCLRIQEKTFPFFQPRIVITTGEVLTSGVRSMMESVFQAKVADIYACGEVGDLAWQCREGKGYHVNADNLILEIVRNGNPVTDEQVGEVVVTGLSRFCMPMIRYNTGDYASWCFEKCPCGRKLPLLRNIVGRMGDDIQLPGGQSVTWNNLKEEMNLPGIRQFQFIQDANADLTIKCVIDSRNQRETVKNLVLERCGKIFRNSISIKVDLVNEILPDQNGKTKLVVSYYRK